MQTEVTGDNLRTFLPDAIELARQGEAVYHSMPSQQVQSMQSAFWLARQLRIVLEDCVQSAPPPARVQLIEALARAIDSSGNNALSKCTVVIGEGAGMDVLGRIWLPYDLPQVLAVLPFSMICIPFQSAARYQLAHSLVPPPLLQTILSMQTILST